MSKKNHIFNVYVENEALDRQVNQLCGLDFGLKVL